MKCSIDIPCADACPLHTIILDDEPCLGQYDKANGCFKSCVGLGNEGCPFKPEEEQSCKTCGNKKNCFKTVMIRWADDIPEGTVTRVQLAHCSAYIKEVIK